MDVRGDAGLWKDLWFSSNPLWSCRLGVAGHEGSRPMTAANGHVDRRVYAQTVSATTATVPK